MLFTKVISKNLLNDLLSYYDIDCKNFINIQYVRPTLKPIYNNFILTSINGLNSIIHLFSIEYLKNKNYYLVGKKSKNRLKKITKNIYIVAENSYNLVSKLIKTNENEFVYFGSNRRLFTIEKELIKTGKKIQRIDSYKTILNPIKIDKKYAAIVFMSPSSVRSFLLLNKKIPETTIFFALGKTTKDTINNYSLNNEIIIPNKTNLNELLNCIKIKLNLFY